MRATLFDSTGHKNAELCCENDMRVALAKVKSRISDHVSERRQGKSHGFPVNIRYYVFVPKSRFFSVVLQILILMRFSFYAPVDYIYIYFLF